MAGAEPRPGQHQRLSRDMVVVHTQGGRSMLVDVRPDTTVKDVLKKAKKGLPDDQDYRLVDVYYEREYTLPKRHTMQSVTELWDDESKHKLVVMQRPPGAEDAKDLPVYPKPPSKRKSSSGSTGKKHRHRSNGSRASKGKASAQDEGSRGGREATGMVRVFVHDDTYFDVPVTPDLTIGGVMAQYLAKSGVQRSTVELVDDNVDREHALSSGMTVEHVIGRWRHPKRHRLLIREATDQSKRSVEETEYASAALSDAGDV